MMTNKAIAQPLKETAALIELTGGNPFRARALANAARIIERLEQPVPKLLAAGELSQIKGIGEGLVAQIKEILEYGSFEVRDEILGGLPPGLLDVLSVKGLGAKKVRVLWRSLGVQSLDDLEGAAVSGRIASLEGFGEKSQQSILENIGHLRSYQGKRRMSDAWKDAAAVMELITKHPDVDSAVFGGDVARAMEIVEEIKIVVTCADEKVESICKDLNLNLKTSREKDSMTASTHLEDGLSLSLIFVDSANRGPAILKAIGPESFTRHFDLASCPKGLEDEKEVFKWSGVPFVQPELRDLPDAFDRAGELSKIDLIEFGDLKGVLHNHSTYSDGAHTLREMSLAVREAGFDYFGICDHSQSLKIANGMSVPSVRKQKKEVASLNKEFAEDGKGHFRVFFGVESDILSDGSLDYEDEVLAEFDFIVASIHVRFNMTEQEATERLIKAIENPYTTILGHPTGRLILKRNGYPIDHNAVLEACARTGVAIELNANPYRLDLDWRWIEKAVELGVPVSINPDAHSIEQLDLMRWGALVARKGGLTAKDCLNALNLKQFETFLDKKKQLSGIA
jgi:DNA polymerase (family 10)